MKFAPFLLFLCFAATTPTESSAQTTPLNTERIWKDLSRLPQNLRDDLKKTTWWRNAEASRSASVRLDSTVKHTSFSSGKTYPLNKSQFEYPAAGKMIQSDFVNFGEWVLQKRSTLTRDAQNRVVEVVEEEPNPDEGGFQPAQKLQFYWRGTSSTQCDSILASTWDEQWQQWLPAYRLISFFNAQGRETATETYRYTDGAQAVGVREEFLFDATGDITTTKQFIAKAGKWAELGRVESKFDQQHHETARQESVVEANGHYAPIRKLRRTYDAQGHMTLEERSKWSAETKDWAPLKAITTGSDVRNRSDWTITESFKPNGNFQSKVETFKRPADDNPDREVQSSLQAKSKKWQVVSETRYFYSK